MRLLLIVVAYLAVGALLVTVGHVPVWLAVAGALIGLIIGRLASGKRMLPRRSG